MKVTLRVDGREMIFSEQELIAIVKNHLASETSRQGTTVKVIPKPTEGEWFEVKPLSIDQTLFQNRRDDKAQEETRQYILEAFFEMKKNPRKYGKNFKTMMPEKVWCYKTVGELEEMAYKLGDHNAAWVEQSLEWAQRIANGETWEEVCNNPDTANYYRLVTWKNGYSRCIGGSSSDIIIYPASNVYNYDFNPVSKLNYTVPLIVRYED